MFCTKCGGNIEEGALFCSKCETAVSTMSEPNTAPQGFANQSIAETQAGWRELPKTAEPPKTMMLVAFILGICALFMHCLRIFVSIQSYKAMETMQAMKSMMELHGTEVKNYWGLELFFSCIFIIALILALILNKFVLHKIDGKKTLAAAILYLVSFNIPSAVICFVACNIYRSQTGSPSEPLT